MRKLVLWDLDINQEIPKDLTPVGVVAYYKDKESNEIWSVKCVCVREINREKDK